MTTSNSLVYLIALPLFGATILLLAGRRADKWGHILGTLMPASSFAVGLYQLSLMSVSYTHLTLPTIYSV